MGLFIRVAAVMILLHLVYGDLRVRLTISS